MERHSITNVSHGLRFAGSLILSASIAGCDAMMYKPFAPHEQTQPATATVSERLDIESAKSQAQAAMQSLLKDPSSAQWNCYEPKWATIGGGKAWGGVDLSGWVLPCEINAKNSYGAYAGATRYAFLYIDQRLRRVAEISGNGAFGTQRIVYDN